MLPTYASIASAIDEQSTIKDHSKPIGLFYFLDSRGGSEGDPTKTDNIPSFVSSGTAEWFKSTAASAKQQWGVLPSLAFVHIPINAFMDSQCGAVVNVGGKHFPGLNADNTLAQQANRAESNNVHTGQDT